MDKDLHVVTGAFGYSGGYIANRLLAAGCRVRTLTNSPARTSILQGKLEAHPFNFHNVDKLASSLVGASVLYNTYWVRFNAGSFSHTDAVRNTLTLFTAAKRAGVARVVHISITNPSPSSPLEYFRGKAQLEEALKATGLSHAILRPAVLFGPEDILINNIAWMLRRFPVFPIFGHGRYRLQPIYVDDLAMRAVEFGASRENVVLDAVGPETFTYREMVKMLGRAIGKPRPTVSVPPGLGQLCGGVLGAMVKDRVITREEIQGLMLDLLYTTSAPLGTTCLSDWAWANSATLGLHYASELRRRIDRVAAYSAA
jgi:NADH dehydrogenase